MSRDLVESLRARKLRVTPQRRAILEAFRDRRDEHLSADEVHARATARVPELGRGTVYATLAELTELGLLAAVGSPEPVRYESNVEPHQHFRCRLCMRLFDIDVPPRSMSAVKHSVERITVTAEGVCDQCGEYERGLRDGIDSMHAEPQLDPGLVGTLACGSHETNLGGLQLAASADGIVRVAFEEHADFRPLAERTRTRRGPREARERIGHAVRAIDGLLGGHRSAADDVVDWEAVGMPGTAALEATRRIPFGTTRSYQQLDAGTSPYECGVAMGKNPMPLLLPCHRVTRGAQAPEAYVGGLERRHRLQDLESA